MFKHAANGDTVFKTFASKTNFLYGTPMLNADRCISRRRAITDDDSRILIENVTEIFNQMEKTVNDELFKRAVTLQRELTFDYWGVFKAMVRL